MSFIIDTQGSRKLREDQHKLNADNVEESDDDFLFIPLQPDQRCSRNDESNKSFELDETYPSFRKTISDKKKTLQNKNHPKSSKGISTLKSSNQPKQNDGLIAKSSTLQPGLEKLERVHPYVETKAFKKSQRKAEQAQTKGSKWFNIPAPEVTEEMKNDIEALQMRSALDPKHFYKKNDMKHAPKYFQIGRVVDSPADYFSSRIPNKERKRTLVDDLLADAEFQKQNKRRYKEIISERQKTTLQYVRQKRRQQKKKSVKTSKSNS